MDLINNVQATRQTSAIDAQEASSGQEKIAEMLLVMARALLALIQAFESSGMGKAGNGGAEDAGIDAPSDVKAPRAKSEVMQNNDAFAHEQDHTQKLQTVNPMEGGSASGGSTARTPHEAPDRDHGASADAVAEAAVPKVPVDDDQPDATKARTGAPAARIDASGFTGEVHQTADGKQSGLEGTKPGQLRHQTGLSGYEERDGVESFSAAPGGHLSGSSSTARSEAYFSGDTTGKSFAANYKVSEDANATIMQQFNSDAGPSLRVSVNDGNELCVNTGDGTPTHLANIDPGQEFRLEVNDLGNGKTSFNVLDLDGKSLGSVEADNTRYGGGNDQFRYGCYLQGDNGGQVIVSDVNTDL